MYEQLISLIIATALLLGSPGPAPLALAAAGATYGVKKGVPFLIGILLGLAVAIVATTMGIVAIFSAFPGVKFTVQILGALYIVYVAQKIARAPVLNPEVEASEKPLRLIDGFVLNLLNPKAYAAFLALFSQFLVQFDSELYSYIFTGIICFLVAVVVDVSWLLLGGVLRPLFEEPKPARIMRVSFAVMRVSAVIWAMSF